MSRAALGAFGLAALARRPMIVKAPQIPASLRDELEETGEEVVSQKLGRPYTNAYPTTPGVAEWESKEDQRRLARLWLKEKRDNRDRLRRRDDRRALFALGLGAAGVLIALGGLVVAVLAYLH